MNWVKLKNPLITYGWYIVEYFHAKIRERRKINKDFIETLTPLEINKSSNKELLEVSDKLVKIVVPNRVSPHLVDFDRYARNPIVAMNTIVKELNNRYLVIQQELIEKNKEISKLKRKT